MQRTKAMRYVTVGTLTLIVLVISVSHVDHNINGVTSNENMNTNLSSSLGNHYEDMNQSTMNKMLERGNIAMGFNQNKITHQFIASPFGGEIIVTALNGSEIETIGQIKKHVLDIQKEFSQGNFTRPFFIHVQDVPGTDVMSQKKDLIKYDKMEMKNGSILILTTNDTELIDAINQFMEFQARQHRGH